VWGPNPRVREGFHKYKVLDEAVVEHSPHPPPPPSPFHLGNATHLPIVKHRANLIINHKNLLGFFLV